MYVVYYDCKFKMINLLKRDEKYIKMKAQGV